MTLNSLIKKIEELEMHIESLEDDIVQLKKVNQTLIDEKHKKQAKRGVAQYTGILDAKWHTQAELAAMYDPAYTTIRRDDEP